MRNIHKYTYALFVSLCLFSALQLISCKTSDIESYKLSKNALWFEKYGEYNSTDMVYPRLDTVEISKTFFPGVDIYTHQFKINLIGNILTSPHEYKLAVIDSLTNTEVLKYVKIPENQTFKAGVTSDSLNVEFNFKNIPDGFRGRVTFELVESDFFKVGFLKYNRIIIWVNNIMSKPIWWKDEIVEIYLGEYSAKKFEEFVLCTGVTSLEGVDSFNRRKICLQFKAYVEKNNIMDKDEDGNEFPMIIPIN